MKKCIIIFPLLACCILLAVGCATGKKTVQEPAFYPPPPEQPRLQFLTSFSSPADLAPAPSAFQTFVVGEDNKKAAPGISKPYGLAVQGSKLYVCDTMGGLVHIVDLVTDKWDYFKTSQMAKPLNIAVDLNNFRYIADAAKKNVQIYNSSGVSVGILDENIGKAAGVSVSKDRIYVADIENHQVHVFGKSTRDFEFSIPRQSDNEEAKLFSPANLANDHKGDLYVSDTGGFRIQKYDRDGNHLLTVGAHGTAPGSFSRNKGVAVDRSGNLYAVDAAFQNIQIFNESGELLLYFGEPGGSAYPLTLPASVFIDYENVALFKKYAAPGFELEYLIFVSNQYGPRKVAVYGFGSMSQP